MALTKIQKSGITDDSIGADQIEDGTILSSDIADGTIANAKLANSSITVNGTSVSLGGSVDAVYLEWQAVKTASFTAVASEGYFVNTTSSAITVTLPASPSIGDTVAIKDYAGTFGTNALTIARNSENIQGQANDSEISTNRASITLVYVDSTKGWLYANESNPAYLGPTFLAATGGTVTTSGDYKIHTFTGDGTFSVSDAGDDGAVSYLVVAGGGSGAPNSTGGGGGGGAGGFREGKWSCDSYTASPLAASNLTVTATSYPITVGGGGTSPGAGSGTGGSGSNSVFSTITSAGGGGGGGYGGPSQAGGSGGAKGYPGGAGSSGNTPPVSPPQGNPGGGMPNPAHNGGGGGGGAGTAGSDSADVTIGGGGGQGATTSISGSPVGYAGGGGGSSNNYSGLAVDGGTPGRPAPNSPNPADAGQGSSRNGAANSGGGSGGTYQGSHISGTGGKGVVIIRYKYQ